ncbi:unnamed protein product [Mytilus coruscus]|uniref:Uncharacterized protein n=1 Tax=Mytilus coruscus TaxID=42192 RepID=A0A6J8D2T4_MYTCO|nr:unnamed protein product [Mytilus coruscus]
MKQFVQTTVKLELKSKKHSSFGGYKRTASIYLSASRYSNVFKTLIKNSKAARTAFRKIMVSEIKKEVSELCKAKHDTVWRSGSKNGINAFNEFSWNSAVEETKRFCPLLVAALSSSLSNNINLQRKFGKTQVSLLPNLGCILGQIVFARKPYTMKFLQEMIGLQMWMSGTSRKAFTRLNHLGITLGTDATRGAVDKIRQGFSKDLTDMREHLTHNNRAAVQIRRRLFDEEDEEGEGVAILDDTLPYAEESDNEDANRNNGRDEDATSLNDTIPFEDEDEVEAFLADDLQEAVMNTPAKD